MAEGGLLNLPWGMAHIDDQSIDKRRIQIKGFWSAIEGVDQSGSMGYMPNRLIFPCFHGAPKHANLVTHRQHESDLAQ